MGRDITGVIVFAKDEKSAYAKARKIFKKLVRKHALWYFYTYDDFDKGAGHVANEFPAFKNLNRAMIVDRSNQSKGYQFVQRIIRGDQASEYQVNQFMDLLSVLSTIKTKEQAKSLLLYDRITFTNSNGKREVKSFIKSDLGNIGDKDKFVHGIYSQYWGKVRSYTELSWVMNRDPNDFQDYPKIAEKMADPGYKIWVVPALSKT